MKYRYIEAFEKLEILKNRFSYAFDDGQKIDLEDITVAFEDMAEELEQTQVKLTDVMTKRIFRKE